MSQKLPVNNFEWIEDTSQFNEYFIKSYNEESDEGYFLEYDIQYTEKLHELYDDLSFFANLPDTTEYAIHIRNLKQALNYGLILKKVHSMIKFNQKAWLKPYIDINNQLRQKAKNNFEKEFFKLMNNAIFGKTIENLRKHVNIKLVTTRRRRNYLVSEPNYHTIKFFMETL